MKLSMAKWFSNNHTNKIKLKEKPLNSYPSQFLKNKQLEVKI